MGDVFSARSGGVDVSTQTLVGEGGEVIAVSETAGADPSRRLGGPSVRTAAVYFQAGASPGPFYDEKPVVHSSARVQRLLAPDPHPPDLPLVDVLGAEIDRPFCYRFHVFELREPRRTQSRVHIVSLLPGDRENVPLPQQ